MKRSTFFNEDVVCSQGDGCGAISTVGENYPTWKKGREKLVLKQNIKFSMYIHNIYITSLIIN